MAFRGWSAEAITFYEGLEADNSKAYWTAHQAVYEQSVRRPMEELLTDLEPEFGAARMFRPYRDVRFSADKSPYKTAIAATLERGGYVSLSADALSAGCGMYHLSPEQLERFRDAVANDSSGEPLQKELDKLTKRGIEISCHEALKRVPRGYPVDHPRADLLRYKGLISWQSWPVGPWLYTAEPKKRVAGLLRASAPIQDWLLKHVGEAE